MRSAGTGNTWVTNRACSTVGVPLTEADGCMMLPDNEHNLCPENAPLDDQGFVWCDCQNEFGHIRLAATESECLRTEGLSDDQQIAYEAAGINVVDYDCECCTCQSTLYAVPKVGEPGKQCDAGSTDPDKTACGDSSYYMFAGACCLLLVAFCVKKVSDRAEEAGENAMMGNELTVTISDDSANRGIKKKGSFKKNNPLMNLSTDSAK